MWAGRREKIKSKIKWGVECKDREQSTRWGKEKILTVNVYFLQWSVWAWMCHVCMVCACKCYVDGWCAWMPEVTLAASKQLHLISGGANVGFLWSRSGSHWSDFHKLNTIKATISAWECKETTMGLGILVVLPQPYGLETICWQYWL